MIRGRATAPGVWPETCLGRIVVDMAHDAIGDELYEVPSALFDEIARTPAELWAGCRGSFFLRIDHHVAALPRWVAPQAADMLAPRLDAQKAA